MLKIGFGFLSGFFARVQGGLTLPSVTVKYPEVKKPLAPLSRCNFKNDFSECTGCKECQNACPVEAISIDGNSYSEYDVRPTTTRGAPFEMEVRSFKIDFSKCIFCGLCVQKCPTSSLGYGRDFPKGEAMVSDLITDLVHIPRVLRKQKNEN